MENEIETETSDTLTRVQSIAFVFAISAIAAVGWKAGNMAMDWAADALARREVRNESEKVLKENN